MLTADWKLIRIGLGSTYDILWVLQDVLEGLGPVTALGDAISIYISVISVTYSEMSVCPQCPLEAVRTVRCPYVPKLLLSRGNWTSGHLSVANSPGEIVHPDISV